jgi:hypothetical protein
VRLFYFKPLFPYFYIINYSPDFLMHNPFPNSNQIGVVSTFSELIETEFKGAMNAICWHRNLNGDFEEIVAHLTLKEDITVINPPDLMALRLTERGRIARDLILHDMQLLTDYGASPSLNLIKCYERDDTFSFITTDVYSYHVDSSPIATDTFLCTYRGSASELISNAEAIPKIEIPEIQKKLFELFEGPLNEFETFLKEQYFDLHYEAKPEAEPINLGVGHLWRLAVEHPNQHVPPCIHRAPIENEGEYRLLLIC